jgi:hypothetical protein
MTNALGRELLKLTEFDEEPQQDSVKFLDKVEETSDQAVSK